MRHLFIFMVCAVILLPAEGFCAEGSYTDAEEGDFPADYREVETDPEVGLSEDGDLSAVVEVEYAMLLSQRLILQPRFETLVALQEVEEYGVGQGINFIEMGLRLRYHFTREFAPFIGVSWNRKLFEAEDLAEKEGEDTDILSFVSGLRI